MNKGKVINGKTSIYLLHNYGLDYESLYEDIPALLADTTGRTVSHPKVEYAQPKPMLEREFPTAASYTGVSRTQYTFKVRAINTNPDFPAGWVPLTPHGTGHNRQFAKVPVTWKVTAPDGTVTEQTVLTGDDGLSSFPLTLGDDGETHTVEAIVPAKTTSGLPVPLNPNYPDPNMALSHEELKVTFTATAVAPPATITLRLDDATHTAIQWSAIVPTPGTVRYEYTYYYKKSADSAWIRVTNLGSIVSGFSFIHSYLEPGTSYDFRLFALQGGHEVTGSNVLTASTLPLKLAATDIQTTSVGLEFTNFVTLPADPDDTVFAYFYKRATTTAWPTSLQGTFRSRSTTVRSLTPDTEYDFQLFVYRDGARRGPGSNVVSVRTLSETPPVPPPEPPPPEPPPEPPAPANNPPVFTSAATVNVQENTTAVITVVAEDPDAEDEITNYAITGGADQALFEIGGASSPLDMLRFKAAPDFEMPQDADTNNVYTVILTATSGTGDRELTANQTLTITVTDVDETPPTPTNRPPVFRSASAVNVAENTTAVITVVAEDPDVGDTITGYAITGGADQTLFEIHGESTPSDMLRFKTAPDFEMPGSAASSNVYTVILTATSGDGDRELTATQTLTITVTDVDETPPPPPQPANRPPVFRSASAVSVLENTTAVITIVAEDPDAEDAMTNYAITGGTDQAMLEIGGTGTPSDMLRFKAAPDFETPQDANTDNVCIIILTATSGVGDRELTANQTLTITVTDVDETPPPPPQPVNRPPAFRSASAVNVAENTTAVVTVVAEDPDAEDEITSYTITGGADQALFEISGTGSPLDMLRFKTAPDFEMPGSAANSNIYTVILTATSGIGDRELTATQTLTITVTVVESPSAPVNRPPVFTSASAVNVAENTTAIVTIVAEDPDVEDAITGYTITGGADQALFEIGGANSPLDMLHFKTAPDFEMPGSAANSNIYTVILTATSGVGDRQLTATQTLTVTVTDVDETPPPPVNRPPVFTSASAVNVAENTTTVIRIAAEDPDAGDTITGYAITGGADQALFEIGGTRSPLDLLRFKTAPDFETPKDADKDNVYTVILTATSGVGDRELTATQTLTITVTDVVERPPPPANRPPVFTSASTVNVAENTTAVITVVAEDPDAEDEITSYAITGGADQALFEIGGTSTPLDMLRFKATPDFETPKDANKDNVYTLILTATSGTGDRELTATQTLTVTVTDIVERPLPPVNRPPVFTSASSVNVAENTTAVITVVAEDPDAADEITSYALTDGADQALFEIGGASSPLDLLRFKTAPDFEMPKSAASSNVYTVILTATSGVGDRELTATQTLTITVTDVDETPPEPPPEPPPPEPPPEPSVGSGGVGTPPPIPIGTQSFIFNEIGNFSDDRNDWIELKNLCNTPLDLSEWQLRLIRNDAVELGGQIEIEIDVVSFPDFLLPPHAVLLITNTEPSETVLAGGLNIATGARQKGAQHPYFVAPDLKLLSTPFLLILQRVAPANGNTTPTLMDVAGNYFWEVSPDGTEVYSYTYTPDFAAETARLTDVGVWQRQRLEQPGYLSTAWRPSGYHGGIGYDRHVAVSVSLGSPGYRSDPSPSQPVASRLVFNEIRNASNDTNDWIELKNVCGAGVQLKHWHISIVLNAGQLVDEEVGIVSLPGYTLQRGDVLLITNTDPSETVLAGGLNIATGARQRGAQHPYLVAPDLKLPEIPYLLILKEVPAYDTPTIEDVAGNYAPTALPDGTEIGPYANVPRSTELLAPLTHFGAWQRRHFVEQPGYLSTAWEASGYHGGIGYDRDVPASVCLGTPGYRHDPSPGLPVTQRLIFNKIHNAGDNPDNYIDWIELKNISDTAVQLKHWAISSVASAGDARDEDVDIVSFPDWMFPAGGVLLILNADPGTRVFNGRNIARDAQQTEAQRDYFVAPDLRLPETPYLLILRHAIGKNGTPDAIEDIAGDYFRTDNDTQVWPLTHTLRPSLPAAPLSEAGTWQRTDARQHGYLATAWRAIESPLVHAYDPDAFAGLPVTQRLVFNKIRNAANDTGDWIELKNISETAVRLKHWEISRILSVSEAADEDIGIVSFPDYTVPVNGVLLITNTEPDETVLVDGLNITPGASPQRGAQHPYLVAPNLKLPETPYLLILRHAIGKNGTPEAIEDVAGDYFRSVDNTADWLLAHTPHPSAPAAPLSETGTWQRKDVRQRGSLATAWTVNLSPPGIGSAPNAPQEKQNAQFTPNANAAVIFNPTLPDEVRITELMYETERPSETLPQWIELYNASQTPVDLKGWQLAVETRTDGTHRHAHLTLKSISLPPKQTVILVTGWHKNSHTLPIEKIYDLSKAHREMLGPRHLKNTLIGKDGFFLQLLHPTGRVVDTCGNLDGDPTTDDLPAWTLPDSKTLQGHRFSLLRRFDGDVRKGTEASGWLPALKIAIGVRHYYGHSSDISTPGFLHQIAPGASPTDALSISEILFETKSRTRALPQWIELYNPSFTRAVKLKDYELLIETRQVSGRHQQIVMTLEAFDVLPNQTALIITAPGKHSGHFPANRTYNISQRHPKALASLPNRSRVLSSEGFLIQLTDATGNVVDTVGNLDGYPFTKDTPAWALPDGETPDGARAAIRRLYEKRIPFDGRHRESWVSTAAVPPVIMTYYGHASDVGNPGFRMGGPLPVVLSRFRAVRDTDTVLISWTTESSLENAGFHLYRSTQHNGGFVRVNPRLIQGAGTTAEQQTYTYVDKPPKNDSVYYYQLQEISYSGQQQVLATARIKGHLSADSKHLTTLGALKTHK